MVVRRAKSNIHVASDDAAGWPREPGCVGASVTLSIAQIRRRRNDTLVTGGDPLAPYVVLPLKYRQRLYEMERPGTRFARESGRAEWWSRRSSKRRPHVARRSTPPSFPSRSPRWRPFFMIRLDSTTRREDRNRFINLYVLIFVASFLAKNGRIAVLYSRYSDMSGEHRWQDTASHRPQPPSFSLTAALLGSRFCNCSWAAVVSRH